MCGIAGIAHRHPAGPIDERQMVSMQRALTHRGPDDAGEWKAPGIGLVSRRLAILDLSSRGRMPMATADGRYHIVYNGEIYNYRELRSELEGTDHRFRSDTDTEVLLQLYARHGADMLDRLNGMFAFAVWDARERSLFIARDRLGIKPVYYTTRGDLMLFASEQKALFAAGVAPEFDTGTWDELMCFRFVSGPRTPYVNVHRLLPGHYLRWQAGEIRVQRWWNLAERARALRERAPVSAVRWYADTFDSAVKLRLISDVPVGVLLSGGLDSGSVATSLSAQAGAGLASFTVRVEAPGHDESPLAREVAAAAGLTSHELALQPADLLSRLLPASALNDEPIAHSSDIHLLAIAEYAKPRVTVLLSGEGSDETLGGYVRYQPLRYARWLPLAHRLAGPLRFAAAPNGRLAKLGRFLDLRSIRQFVMLNACDVLPADLARLGRLAPGTFAYRDAVVAEAEALYPGEPMRQAMYSDQHTFLGSLLHRNDRMTMGASIECRVPFLDYRLVEGTAALPSSVLLPGHQSKPLLRRALAPRLPLSVQRHKKWGFGVPWAHYLRTVPELLECAMELPRVEPILSGPFDVKKVQAVVDGFRNGDPLSSSLVVQLVMITAWYRACVMSRPDRIAADRDSDVFTDSGTMRQWAEPKSLRAGHR